MYKVSAKLFIVICIHHICKNEQWFPRQLGGVGDVNNWYVEWPAWPKPRYFDLFYFIPLGFYLEDILHLIWQPRLNDFSEMVLHHLVTVSLMVYSYLMNFSTVGIIIIQLHSV